jgi:translation elongation factor EF-Ts
MPCFKYFINKTTVLLQYREALQQAKTISDPMLREEMKQFMRDEFAPFRKFRTVSDQNQKVQDDIDYLLAKARQRISQVMRYAERTQ